MLPHRDTQDQIKGLATCPGLAEKRQAIVKPFHVAPLVERFSRVSKLAHRFDGKDAVPSFGQPCRIASRACPDVQRLARARREKVENGSKDIFGLQGLETGHQLVRV